jgi:hypothetical protein
LKYVAVDFEKKAAMLDSRSVALHLFHRQVLYIVIERDEPVLELSHQPALISGLYLEPDRDMMRSLMLPAASRGL